MSDIRVKDDLVMLFVENLHFAIALTHLCPIAYIILMVTRYVE